MCTSCYWVLLININIWEHKKNTRLCIVSIGNLKEKQTKHEGLSDNMMWGKNESLYKRWTVWNETWINSAPAFNRFIQKILCFACCVVLANAEWNLWLIPGYIQSEHTVGKLSLKCSDRFQGRPIWNPLLSGFSSELGIINTRSKGLLIKLGIINLDFF